MKTLLFPLFFLCLFLAQPLSAQQLTEDEKSQYAKDVTTNPEVVGGFGELGKVLQYPKEAVEAGVSGTVQVTAFINEDGEVDDTEVYKSDNQLLDSAALSAVKLVKFTPGKIDGTAVKCRVLVPIRFRMQ
jgi:TonB family protein